MIRVCFVCLGNICRSPTAEAIMRKLVEDAGLHDKIQIDSAGTSDYHTGENADRRTRETAKRHGVNIDQKARQFQKEDFERFEYVIAMDRMNKQSLTNLAPRNTSVTIHLLREFAGDTELDVPDPYYGGGDGFERVFGICHNACQHLLAHIRRTHDL